MRLCKRTCNGKLDQPTLLGFQILLSLLINLLHGTCEASVALSLDAGVPLNRKRYGESSGRSSYRSPVFRPSSGSRSVPVLDNQLAPSEPTPSFTSFCYLHPVSGFPSLISALDQFYIWNFPDPDLMHMKHISIPCLTGEITLRYDPMHNICLRGVDTLAVKTLSSPNWAKCRSFRTCAIPLKRQLSFQNHYIDLVQCFSQPSREVIDEFIIPLFVARSFFRVSLNFTNVDLHIPAYSNIGSFDPIHHPTKNLSLYHLGALSDFSCSAKTRPSCPPENYLFYNPVVFIDVATYSITKILTQEVVPVTILPNGVPVFFDSDSLAYYNLSAKFFDIPDPGYFIPPPVPWYDRVVREILSFLFSLILDLLKFVVSKSLFSFMAFAATQQATNNWPFSLLVSIVAASWTS